MSTWEEVSAKKRQAVLAAIPAEYKLPKLPSDSQLDVTTFPRESGWFTEQELAITESTATQILEKIHARTWTSEEVTRAFCKRAAAAHQLVSVPICMFEYVLMLNARQTACLRSSSTMALIRRRRLTNIWKVPAS